MARLLPAIAALAFVASASASSAQTQAQTRSTATSATEFIDTAASSNMLEIQSSEMALDKVQEAEVKKFAQQMIQDHKAATEKLQGVAGQRLPSSMNQKHSGMLQKLQGTSGNDFTRAYVTLQAEAHTEAVQLFDTYAKNGEDAKLKSFAQQTLPTLNQHLQHVEQLQKSLKP